MEQHGYCFWGLAPTETSHYVANDLQRRTDRNFTFEAFQRNRLGFPKGSY